MPQRKRRRHRLGESTVSAERQRACNRVLADRGRVSPLCGRRRICRGVRSQVVAITGASAGVGRATALAFARRGIGRDDRPRRGTARLGAPRDRGLRRPRPWPCPPTSPTRSRSRPRPSGSRRSSARSTSGSTTRWRPCSRRSRDTEPEEFRRATEVTYLGSVWGTMAALERMRPRDRGVIVQVGSALAYRGIPLQAAYCGAKHALQGFLESLRTELLHDGSNVRLTMVQLPALNTPQFTWSRAKMPHQPQPVPPIFQPEVAAEAIVFAAGHPTARVDGRLADGQGDLRQRRRAGRRRPLPRRRRLRGAADRRAR